MTTTQDPDIWGVSWKFEGAAFKKLLDLAESHTYSAQTAVFSEGDPADGMYLVTEGYGLVMKTDPVTGGEYTVAIIEPGQSFGELGFWSAVRVTRQLPRERN